VFSRPSAQDSTRFDYLLPNVKLDKIASSTRGNALAKLLVRLFEKIGAFKQFELISRNESC
jgi:hypothetical protein